MIDTQIEFKTSPTPWKVTIAGDGAVFISDAASKYICDVDGSDDGDVNEHNARLIVAAVNAAAGISIEQLEDPDG